MMQIFDLPRKYPQHYFYQPATLIYLCCLLAEVLKGNVVTPPLMYIPTPSHYYLFPENLSISSVLSSALAREPLIICMVTVFRLQGIPFMWPLSLKVWKTSMPGLVIWLGKRARSLDTQPLA